MVLLCVLFFFFSYLLLVELLFVIDDLSHIILIVLLLLDIYGFQELILVSDEQLIELCTYVSDLLDSCEIVSLFSI